MRNQISKIFAAAFFVAVPLESTATPYYANKTEVVTIRSDRGGVMLHYALRMKKLERRGSLVRFGGQCDSACTLFLALPRNQVCLLPGASFRFHKPYGSSEKNNRIAANFMLKNYPGWVRSWLRERGGLATSLKTMNYGYAAKFIKQCDTEKGKKSPVTLASFVQRSR